MIKLFSKSKCSDMEAVLASLYSKAMSQMPGSKQQTDTKRQISELEKKIEECKKSKTVTGSVKTKRKSALLDLIDAFATKKDYTIIRAVTQVMPLYKYCGVFKAKYGANINCGRDRYYAEVGDSWSTFYPENHGAKDLEKFEYPKFIFVWDRKTDEMKHEIDVEDVLEQLIKTHNILNM